MRVTRAQFSVLTFLVALQLAGCGMSTAKPHAEAAVRLFHKQMNAGEYQVIWNTADDEIGRAHV